MKVSLRCCERNIIINKSKIMLEEAKQEKMNFSCRV